MLTGNCTEETKSNTKEYLAHVHLIDKATQRRYARFSSLLLFAAFFFYLLLPPAPHSPPLYVDLICRIIAR